MTLLDSARLAYHALRINPLRSFLAMLGIVIGVAVVVAMIAIGQGSQARIEEQLRSLGTNLLYVLPRSEDAAGNPLEHAGRNPLTEDDAAAITAEVSHILVAAPMISEDATIVHGNRHWYSTVVGTHPGAVEAREWKIADGRGFTLDEVEAASKVVVIGDTVKRKLFGGDAAVGQIVRIENVPLTVVGVLKAKGNDAEGWDQDDVVYAPITTARLRMIGSAAPAGRRSVGLILVKVGNRSQLEPTVAAIQGLMRQRHGLQDGRSDDFNVRNMEALVNQRDEAAHTLTIQLAALASVALLVGGIAVMNIMVVSVTERTREIGLRQALGAHRADIRNQFLVEALLLCLVGGLVGVLAGSGLAVVFARLGDWPFVISPGSILLALVAAISVGLISGLYPAHKASLMEPVAALRHE